MQEMLHNHGSFSLWGICRNPDIVEKILDTIGRNGGAARKLYSPQIFIYFFAILHEYGTNFEQWALSLEPWTGQPLCDGFA